MDYVAIGVSIAVVLLSLWALAAGHNSGKHFRNLIKGRAPLPPGGLGLPFLGQSLELFNDFKSSPDNFWRKRNARYGNSGLYKTHFVGEPIIMATTPEMIKFTLLNDDKFTSGWPQSTRKVAGDSSIILLSGDPHKRLRKLAYTSISSPPALKRLISLVETMAHDTLNSWAEKRDLVLLPELKVFFFNTICGTIASIPPGPESSQFCEDYETVASALRVFPIYLPGFTYYRALKSRKRVEERIQKYINERNAKQEGAYGDILESLVKMTDENGEKLSSKEIIDMILGFLFAGHKTSSHTTLWIMNFLYQNPDKLQRLKEEQQKIVAEKGSADGLTPSDYKGMKYMNWVIDETLRLMNMAPFTYRRAAQNIEVQGYTIPKGWNVTAWLRAVHLNEEFFPDPYAFKPERWEDMRPKAGTYAPFGLGGRSCIGIDFAKLELGVIMHHLVLNYRWEFLNPESKVMYLPHPVPGSDGCPIRFYRA